MARAETLPVRTSARTLRASDRGVRSFTTSEERSSQTKKSHARHGGAGRGSARHGWARRGEAGVRGKGGRHTSRFESWTPTRGAARPGAARLGRAWRGTAWLGRAWAVGGRTAYLRVRVLGVHDRGWAGYQQHTAHGIHHTEGIANEGSDHVHGNPLAADA